MKNVGRNKAIKNSLRCSVNTRNHKRPINTFNLGSQTIWSDSLPWLSENFKAAQIQRVYKFKTSARRPNVCLISKV